MATPPLSFQRPPPVQAGGFRRSFTQPHRSLSFHERAGLDPSDSAADILYSHSRARIVSFTPPTNAVRSLSSPGSIDLDYPIDTIETLPWASSTEEVIASGSLVIEKIRGSTNFLKSGDKPLHALMRNSQCWCVDGEAKLVLRVGAFKYYRIELPYNTEDDRADVRRLKDVLKRILRFEATPCPFKRGFHVDLPESATTPRKKGPWKRRAGSSIPSPRSASPSPLSLKKARAQVAPPEQVEQCEVHLPNINVKGMDAGTFNHAGFLENQDHVVLPGIGVGDGSARTKTDSEPRNAHVADRLKLTSTAGSSQHWALQNDDNDPKQEGVAGENEGTAEAHEGTGEDHEGTTGEHEGTTEEQGDIAAEQEHATDGQGYTAKEQDYTAEEQAHTAEDLEGTVGAQSVCDQPDIIDHSLELYDGKTEGQAEDDIRFGQLGDASALTSHSTTRIDNERGPLESLGNVLSLPDKQCSTVPDKSSSLVSLADEPDHMSFSQDDIFKYREQPTTEVTTELAGPLGGPTNELLEQGSSGNLGAGKTEEAGPNSQAWPADSTEPVQLRPTSPVLFEDRAINPSASPEGKTVEAVDSNHPKSISSGADSQLSDTLSVSSLAESFHSIVSSEGRSSLSQANKAEASSLTSPGELYDPLTTPYFHHRRDISEKTITTGGAPTLETAMPVLPSRPLTATSEGPSTPSLLRSCASDASWPDVETPGTVATENDLRRGMRTKRPFSPSPPASTLFTPSPQSPRGSHLTGAILQKACNLALGIKPIEVVVMLVHILARIAGGATVNDLINGDLFRRPPGPASEHRRNQSLPAQTEYRSCEASDEDDYGVPIRSRSRSAAPTAGKDNDADSLFDLD